MSQNSWFVPHLFISMMYAHVHLPFQEHFFKDFIYLFYERGEWKEKEKERNMCGCPPHDPTWEPGLQPRHVPWPGSEPATFQCSGRCSIHWATPARTRLYYLIVSTDSSYFKRMVELHINFTFKFPIHLEFFFNSKVSKNWIPLLFNSFTHT